MFDLQADWYQTDKRPGLLLRWLERFYLQQFQRQQLKKQQTQWQPPVPLIVVGNIAVGGTGKTPVVAWLVDVLHQAGFSPGIVSRGYKAKPPRFPWAVSSQDDPSESGDEPLMLAKRCQCPLVIDPNRPEAARYLLDQFECDVIISDDGLQHSALGRDIEIVVIDGQRGLGNGHCLPAGPLREPATRLTDVDFVISNGDCQHATISTDAVMKLEPVEFVSFGQQPFSLDHFQGQRVHALAGIGNPQRFFNTLKDLQVDVIPHSFSDHHQYRAEELKFEPELSILTTEKDAVKLDKLLSKEAAWLKVAASFDESFAEAILARVADAKHRKAK